MDALITGKGRPVTIAPGVPIRPVIEASIPLASHDPGAITEADLAHANFRLEYSTTNGRYEIAAFGLDRRNADIEITGATLRTVKVHAITRTAVTATLPEWVQPLARATSTHRTGPLRLSRADPDALLVAAAVYRIAEIANENPAHAVAETLGLKTRSATNWVLAARKAGLFEDASHSPQLKQAISRLFPTVG